MIDIGLNLASKQFQSDRAEIVKNALSSGVSGFILTGTNLKTSNLVLEFARADSKIMCSTYGVHPHNASELTNSSMLLEHVNDKHIVAIGECGLDYDRMLSNREEQLHALEIQLSVANLVHKPVFLHLRPKVGEEEKVLNDFLLIYKKYNCPGVVHCFTGNKTMLKTLLDLNLSIGITGWVADKKRGLELASIVQYIPNDKIMIETDAPYLTPQNMPKHLFKRRNEPKFLKYVLDAVATCRNTNIKDLELLTDTNVENLFGWKPI